jgi:hypothetical protein
VGRVHHVDNPTPRHAGDAARLDAITRAPTDAPVVRIRDILLVCWSDADGDEREFPPVTDPVPLGRDLCLVRLDNDEAQLVVSACLPRGHYFVPTWQSPFLYAFEREINVAGYDTDRFSWDTDGTIKTALQLSRLVVDHGYSTEFAARIVDHADAHQQIVPHFIHLLRFTPTYRLRRDRDWFTDGDAHALARLLAAYWATMEALPPRVHRAISVGESVVHSGTVERSLVLLMMGLEPLLNTHDEKVAKQITTRIPLLAHDVGVPNVSKTFASQMYDERSRPAHGQELSLQAWTANTEEGNGSSEVSPAYLEKLGRLQDILRAATRKAIEDPEFAAVFQEEHTIRTRWPVTVDGVHY